MLTIWLSSESSEGTNGKWQKATRLQSDIPTTTEDHGKNPLDFKEKSIESRMPRHKHCYYYGTEH